MKKQLIILMMMLLPMVVMADAVEIDGIYYNIIKKGNVAEVTTNPEKYTGVVDIPSSVAYDGVNYVVAVIGELAFSGCSGLNSVIIPNSVTTIGYGAFYNCTNLTTFTIPNSVTTIGPAVFYNCCSLNSVNISDNITTIEGEAFAYCSGLTSIYIPKSVTNIGGYAFKGCSGLSSVHISDIARWCEISFENSFSNPLYLAHHLYLGDEEIKDLVIPESITSIKSNAFAGCSGLTSVTIPDNITSIEGEAFFYCNNLTSITIPSSVTEIENGVFQGCSSLNYVNIPNSVTWISEVAFELCTSLTSLIIPNSVVYIGDGVFSGCSSLTSVTIGSGIKDIMNSAFALCTELTDVYCLSKEVPYTVTNAFDHSYIEYAILHVPEASITSYKSVEPWKNFKEIVKIDKPIYTLKYIVDEDVYKTYVIEENATIIPETPPTKEGYTFSGWSEIPETMPAHDVMVTGTFYKKGDANGDNSVNAADIVEVVNYIMENPSEKFNKTASDVNNDGEVNDLDIKEIVNIIMESE